MDLSGTRPRHPKSEFLSIIRATRRFRTRDSPPWPTCREQLSTVDVVDDTDVVVVQRTRSTQAPHALLQEWLQTAALAKRTRDAPSMRARLSLCTQGFRGVGQAGGCGESRSVNRVVARTPPLADRMGRKSLQVSPREGAGLRVGRVRWSGHYPRVRERWGGAEPVRTATRG